MSARTKQSKTTLEGRSSEGPLGTGPGTRTVRIKFRDRKEAMRRYRAANGRRQLGMTLRVDAAAALIYLKKQWGFQSNAECVNTVLVYLAQETRAGLQKIDLGGEARVHQVV
jgi:hypothetical protein